MSLLQIEKKYFEKIISFPKIHTSISFSSSLDKHTQSWNFIFLTLKLNHF